MNNHPGNALHAIFVENHMPVRFYLWGTHDEHSSWRLTPGQRDALSEKITAHGGEVCEHVGDADTVIVGDRGLATLREQYESLSRYAEGLAFVQGCIRNRRYAHGYVQQKPMGGRPAGPRQSFSPADDEHLCEFLAHAIPYPAAGGRLGMKVWAQLMESAKVNPEHAWALSHTQQSWRERYKKNRERLDLEIASIVERCSPPPDGKGLFGYDRRLNKHRVRGNARGSEDEGEGSEPEGYNEFA